MVFLDQNALDACTLRMHNKPIASLEWTFLKDCLVSQHKGIQIYHSAINTISFVNCSLSKKQLQDLMKIMDMKGCQIGGLDISGHPELGQDLVKLVEVCVYTFGLKELKLNRCNIDDNILTSMAPALKCMVDNSTPMKKNKDPPCNLQRLELSGNGFGDNGLHELFKLWESVSGESSLKTLMMDDNKFGDVGATVVANLVSKKLVWRVQHLTLVGNCIEDKGAEALARMMRACKELMEFDISNNDGITEKGLQFFNNEDDEEEIVMDATARSDDPPESQPHLDAMKSEMAVLRATKNNQ